MSKLSTNRFAAYYAHDKEIPGITKYAYNPLLLQPPLQLSSLSGDLSNCIIKFSTYHFHCKEILRMIESIYNSFVLWPPLKLPSLLDVSSDYCDWTNFSTALFFTHNINVCIAQLSMGKPLKTSLYIFSDTFQPPFLLFYLILSKFCWVIFEYLGIPQYMPVMSK